MKLALRKSPVVNHRNHLPFFEGVFNGFFDDEMTKTWKQRPSVNVAETETSYRLDIAAPGLDKELFNIEIDKDQLIISYDEKKEEDTKEEKFSRREFNFSSFTRKFHLPETINTEEITAEYNSGILHVTLGKKEEAKDKGIRKIAIN